MVKDEMNGIFHIRDGCDEIETAFKRIRLRLLINKV